MKQNYRALTSLRFFAAVAVFGYHYAPKIDGFGAVPQPLQNLIHCGPVALCFFFTLSGFVLAISYRNKGVNQGRARRAFWYARFARLYPAYIAAFLLFAPIAIQKYVLHPAPEAIASSHRTLLAGVILSPLMLQAWTSFSQAWNGPGWSLSVEAFFYFLFPFVAYRLQRQTTRAVIALASGLWGLSLLPVLAHISGFMTIEFYHNHIQYHPLLWTPCFIMGIGISRFSERWQRVPGAFVSAVVLSTLAVLVLLCACCPAHYWEIVVTTGLLPLFALLIIACSHQRSRFVNALGAPPLYRLGEVSYIMYIMQAPLWHYFAFGTNWITGRNQLSPQVSIWQFALFLPMLLWLSFMFSRHVDRGIRRWILQESDQLEHQLSSRDDGPRELVPTRATE
jgi:peptidoglycan/LPS O-acetylase OafA/YrhL